MWGTPLFLYTWYTVSVFIIHSSIIMRLHTIKIIALAVSIVIVLNLFVNFGIQTFYREPTFEAICKDPGRAYTEQQACEDVGGRWYQGDEYPDHYGYPRKMVPAPVVTPEANQPTAWCDPFFTCSTQYEEQRSLYERNVFLILVVVGLVAFGIGTFVSAAPAVSSGFIFGGVFSFIIGTMRYWSGMHDYLRFIILGVALAVLIWIGYTKLKKEP